MREFLKGELAPLPLSHYWCHYPKDMRCGFCARSLGAQDPAPESLENDFVNAPSEALEVVTTDTVQCSKPYTHGNSWAQTAKDLYTKWPRLQAHFANDGEDAWEAFEILFPGRSFFL